jgi:ABC-type sugar transport system substrate-binding protein
MKIDVRFGVRSRAALAVTALVASAAISGCAQGDDGAAAANGKKCEKTYTVGFSHPISEASFVKSLKRKVSEQAKKIGCVKVLLDSTQANNLETQRATIESWVTQKIDAIVVLPVDAESLKSLQAQAQAQGTKWLTYSGPTKGSDGSVGFDNDASGEMVGKAAVAWAKKNYPDGNLTAAVTTLVPLYGFRGRWEKPIDALKTADIKVVSDQYCADQGCGLKIAESVLREHPDLRIFLGLNDDAALGALRAFDNAGIDPKTVFIAGQDGSLEGLTAVKKGGAYKMSVAILQDDLAHSIIQNAINAKTGKGPTDNESAVEAGTLDDPATLDKLLGQYGEK